MKNVISVMPGKTSGSLVIACAMAVLVGATSCSDRKNKSEGDEASAPVNYLNESPEEKAVRMEWWKDARFGMFIHWGLYAVPAGEYKGQRVDGIGEWIMNSLHIPIAEYEQFATVFNPVQFDADAWVALAKDAGMKYIVITSKHHDGFALWDSRVSEWDIMDATPFKRDILKELADACEKQGIRLCFYHSIMDWHHPDAQAMWEPNYNQGRNSDKVNPRFPEYIEQYMKPQLRELITNYGDIGVLWFDGEWIPAYTTEMGKDVYNYVRGLKPDIIINNRVDKGRQGMQGMDKEGEFAGDFGTPEQEIPDTGMPGVEGMDKEGEFAGDFGTPEQEIPDTGMPGVDWESCMTMNDTWGYKYFDDNWKSDETLIRNLIDIVSKGGNFLLNVGPTAEGVIPEESVERLRAMGRWMDVNGRSIYGAEASPFESPEWGRYTQDDKAVYVHVFDWPEDETLNVPLNAEGKKVYLLSDPGQEPLPVQAAAGETVIKLPNDAPDDIATVIVIEK
jgi:alpha-L-fucosidase